MHILRANQGHNVLLYSGIHLTGKLDELLRIFLIRREQLSCLGIIGGFQKVLYRGTGSRGGHACATGRI